MYNNKNIEDLTSSEILDIAENAERLTRGTSAGNSENNVSLVMTAIVGLCHRVRELEERLGEAKSPTES